MPQFSRLLSVSALLCALAMSAMTSAVAAAEDDRAKFVQWNAEIEADPLADGQQAKRNWMLYWANGSGEVSLLVCDIFRPIQTSGSEYAGILVTQVLFGNAAFQIENQKLKDDLLATQEAGIASSLMVYAKLVEQKPQARFDYFDELLAAKRLGTLRDSVAGLIDGKCDLPKADEK